MRATSLAGLMIAGLFVVLPGGSAAGQISGADEGTTAEQRLRHRLQVNPDDPAVLARLARLYAATGRPEKAKRLYGAMMTLEDVELYQATGVPVSSRLLASSALKQMDAAKPVRIGSR